MSPTACVCLIVSDLETSNRRRPRTDLGCGAPPPKGSFYCLHKDALLVLIQGQTNQVQTPRNYLLKIHHNIMSSNMPACSKLPFPCRFPYHNPVCISSTPPPEYRDPVQKAYIEIALNRRCIYFACDTC
jgi:hypothetical protein